MFDVLISSKQRLQMFHLPSGTDYMTNPKLCSYIPMMEMKFNPNNFAAQNPDSVYQMDVDKRFYDVSDPEFV